jgi:hypothetical protein
MVRPYVYTYSDSSFIIRIAFSALSSMTTHTEGLSISQAKAGEIRNKANRNAINDLSQFSIIFPPNLRRDQDFKNYWDYNFSVFIAIEINDFKC